jgi:hypothetical protein
VLIDRCCSILQGAGMTRAGFERFRSPAPPGPDSALMGPISAEASSMSSVEASIRFVPSTTKSWPLALAALTLVAAGAAGMLVHDGVNEPGAPVLTPLAVPAAAAPSEGPSVTSLPPAPVPAPPLPERATAKEASQHQTATSGAAGASPGLEAAPALDGKPPLDGKSSVSDDAPPPAAASPAPSTTAAAAPDLSGVAPRRIEPPKPKPAAAPPRHRVSPPAPKPRPAPSARSIPAPQEEPDIGF